MNDGHLWFGISRSSYNLSFLTCSSSTVKSFVQHPQGFPNYMVSKHLITSHETKLPTSDSHAFQTTHHPVEQEKHPFPVV